jgi:hypothetical protein
MTDSINDAHKLVTDGHWHWNGFLRPVIPVVYVHVGTADGCFQDADEHVIPGKLWNRNFLQPETGLAFGFHDGLHHLLHNRKLG